MPRPDASVATADPEFVGRLGDEFEDDAIVEIMGEIGCPTPGCDGKGQRVRIIRTLIDQPCQRCCEQAEAARAEEERLEQVAQLLARAGCTERMADWSFESCPDDEPGRAAKRVADQWVTSYLRRARGEPVPNLLLYGPVGGGKTGLAWSIVRHFCEQGIEARLLNFPDLLEQMKEAYSKKVPFDKFTDLGRVSVLALDDVGAERPTEWAVAQLLSLVDRRYQRMLPTIYTSNYEPNDLAKRLSHTDSQVGKRIVSRMIEGAIQHRIRATDRRLPAA